MALHIFITLDHPQKNPQGLGNPELNGTTKKPSPKDDAKFIFKEDLSPLNNRQKTSQESSTPEPKVIDKDESPGRKDVEILINPQREEDLANKNVEIVRQNKLRQDVMEIKSAMLNSKSRAKESGAVKRAESTYQLGVFSARARQESHQSRAI